jgi:hypothetical protein
MFQMHSNIAWGQLEDEIINVTESENLKYFNLKRNVIMRNLKWGSKESFVIPIVLQGNGYNLDDTYNLEVRRNVFDFHKIDINQKSFAFTLEGSTLNLEWSAGKYDIDRDILVVWVRVDNWSGQRITMYYSDNRAVQIKTNRNPYYGDWYSVWRMDENIKIPRSRFINQKVFNAGENFINLKDSDGKDYLIQVDKQFLFGSVNTYMSNKFDIEWDDRTVNKKDSTLIESFIRDNVANFKPSFMELRDIKSNLPYKLESGSNGQNIRGNISNDDNIVVSAPPTIVVCR